MLFCRQRFCQTNNLFVMCSLLLATGFIIQLKILYNRQQKNARLVEYHQRISDVSETIMSVDKIANYTSVLMNKLQIAIKEASKSRKVKFKQR